MPDPAVLISFLVMHWLITMSPGPNTVLVTRTAVVGGRAAAFAVIAGICASAVIWVTSAALGLTLVFAAAPWLRTFLTLAGGGYLIWLGLGMIRAGRRRPEVPIEPPRPAATLRLSFVRGFVANITNPKTLAYFSSVFVTALPADRGAGAILALVLITWICNVGWYGGLALLLATAPVRRLHERCRHLIDRVAGLVMIAFGVRVTVQRL